MSEEGTWKLRDNVKAEFDYFKVSNIIFRNR